MPKPTPADQPLEDRYGTSRSATRAGRVTMWVFAGVGLIALVVWLVWANPLKVGPSINAEDIGHTVISDRQVDVDFAVTVTVGHPFACAVKALNAGFGVVGWKVVAYPASDAHNQTLTVSVKTTEPPATGLVANCWLT